MRKKSKWEYFVKMTHFLMGKYGFDKPLEVVRDNRIDCCCCVADWDDKSKIKIQYHSRRLGQVPDCYILNYILHEIGHLINNKNYATEYEIIQSEYEAEKFSVDTLKSDYPKLYKEMLKKMTKKKSMLKLFKNKSDRNPYYWAYKEIEEYWNTISKEDKQWLIQKEQKLQKL